MKNLQMFFTYSPRSSGCCEKVIMEIYESKELGIQIEEDKSPLTIAENDKESINEFLLPTNFLLISEENKQMDLCNRTLVRMSDRKPV